MSAKRDEHVEKLILVSGNPNKGIEAERILGVPLLRVSISLPEIQAADVGEITRYKLEVARTKGYGRLIVEDVALGFDELGNFPGPYVKWLLEAAGGKGLGAIAYALLNRSAKAQCCVAYWNGDESKIFLGECNGVQAAWIDKDVRGDGAGRERRHLASRSGVSHVARPFAPRANRPFCRTR